MRACASFLLPIALAAACLFACGGDDSSSSGGDTPGAQAGAPPGTNDPHDPNVEQLPDPLTGMPKGQTQLQTVCMRGARDAVTKAFCGGPNGRAATPTNIVELQEALGLGFSDRSDQGTNGTNGNPAFAFSGHSSSIVARDVSAINPRAFIFTPPPGQPQFIPGYVVMTFVRGEPFVEIAAHDPFQRRLTFYLFRFEMACESGGPGACKPGDTLTPAIEKNWKSFSLYDDEDLKNTLLDCRQCHQPNGPGTNKMLRMQELQDSWTHWFRNDDQHPDGLALLKDFRAAHGEGEDYAGIPSKIIQLGDGAALEDFVVGQGFSQQPNSFNSKRITAEFQMFGKSPTWQQLYDNAVRGDAIPPPYFAAKVTDPDKLKFATDAYQQFLGGGDPKALPDIRRVFLDAALPDMSMRPKASATGEEVVVHMCSQCHNGRLDSSLSRAHFDATNLAGMTASQKQMAVARMKLPASDVHHMPPAMLRTIPDDQLQLAVTALSQ